MDIAGPFNGAARRLPTWPIYLGGGLWSAWLFYLGLTGGLGVEPINALERAYGETALQLLVGGLCITPLRKHLGVNFIRFRRAIGLTAFYYVLIHFLVWGLIDLQNLSAVGADILKRPYITVGMTGFVILIPLALTSNDRSIRKLRSFWRKLHKLTYVAALLGAIHFLWLVKGFQWEPVFYTATILALLLLRVDKNTFKRH